MLTIPDLTYRVREPELMDDPELRADRHRRALDGLALVNRVSLAAASLVRPLRELTATDGRGRVRILDLACGGGDVAIDLERRIRRAGVAAVVDGCDLSRRAVVHAAERAGSAGTEGRFFVANALEDGPPDGYDVLLTTLFLHHLPRDRVLELLAKMAGAARRGVLVSDLERGVPGYLAAVLGTRLLTRSRVVRTDGPLSVRAAFTRAELATLAAEAGLSGSRVDRRWPWRLILRWRRP